MINLNIPLVLKIIILVWLLLCTYFDLKSREVPNPLTIIPLILSCIYCILFFSWAQVIFVIFLFFASDLPSSLRLPSGIVAIVLGIFLFPDMVFLFTAHFLFWSLWIFEVMGGADVKILMTTLLLTQANHLGIYILIAGGFLGLLYLLRKEKTFPYTLAITTGTSLYLFTTTI